MASLRLGVDLATRGGKSIRLGIDLPPAAAKSSNLQWGRHEGQARARALVGFVTPLLAQQEQPCAVVEARALRRSSRASDATLNLWVVGRGDSSVATHARNITRSSNCAFSLRQMSQYVMGDRRSNGPLCWRSQAESVWRHCDLA